MGGASIGQLVDTVWLLWDASLLVRAMFLQDISSGFCLAILLRRASDVAFALQIKFLMAGVGAAGFVVLLRGAGNINFILRVC